MSVYDLPVRRCNASVTNLYFIAKLSSTALVYPAGSSGFGWLVALQNRLMELGMSSGCRKEGWSGSTRLRNAGIVPARSVSSEYEKVCPFNCQSRRQHWRSQSPAIFLSKRKVPQSPPSLVKLSS